MLILADRYSTNLLSNFLNYNYKYYTKYSLCISLQERERENGIEKKPKLFKNERRLKEK